MTALYFVVMTISTVGFGDITPIDTQARGFVLALIMIGVVVIGSSVSVLLVPLLSNRLRSILGSQEYYVKSSKHYVVTGVSPLARDAAAELEKRGQSITLILSKPSEDAFYEKRDVVIGDPTDLDVLESAGAAKPGACSRCRRTT